MPRSASECPGVPLSASDVRQVEAFAAALRERFSRLHILINNAAQTLTREPGWFLRMDRLESAAAAALPAEGRALIVHSEAYLLRTAFHAGLPSEEGAAAAYVGSSSGVGAVKGDPHTAGGTACGVLLPAGRAHAANGLEEALAPGVNSHQEALAPDAPAGVCLVHPPAVSGAIVMAKGVKAAAAQSDDGGGHGSQAGLSVADLAAFPEGKLDETWQPLDLSTQVSPTGLPLEPDLDCLWLGHLCEAPFSPGLFTPELVVAPYRRGLNLRAAPHAQRQHRRPICAVRRAPVAAGSARGRSRRTLRTHHQRVGSRGQVFGGEEGVGTPSHKYE